MSIALGTFMNVPIVKDHELFGYALVTKLRQILFTSYKVAAKCDLVPLASA